LKYFEELKRSMEFLARDSRTIFIGQAVEVPGTAMSNTLIDISLGKRLELPVAEEMQMGMTLGLGLQGLIPVSIYPRWNFLILAINQLVNHIDKIDIMSGGRYKPKLIIRTGIGSERPLHPQHQHIGDFTEAIQRMCTTVEVLRLEKPEDIFPSYEKALMREDRRNTILVEYGDYYNEK
jgi:Pyruvate/2-oxoglutarate dehydrogenase complex, dehydrogenase (E1) component, eukaryotic type, beta subunit